MAQVVVDSSVMRDKGKILHDQATKIKTLYEEMRSEVSGIGNKMRGTTIETAVKQFNSMQPKFDGINTDINSYGAFLESAAEDYDAVEAAGTQLAEQQGKF